MNNLHPVTVWGIKLGHDQDDISVAGEVIRTADPIDGELLGLITFSEMGAETDGAFVVAGDCGDASQDWGNIFADAFIASVKELVDRYGKDVVKGFADLF